jgi:ABC-2 type transport system permease protein
VRPYAYAGYRFAMYVSERFVFFPVKLAVAAGLCLLYVGPVAFSPSGVALGLAALALATVLDFLLVFAIALLAFWTESTSSIGLIYDRLVMLLGGMLLPLEVFPEPLGSIARALPFSSLVYAPARLALGGAAEPAEVLFGKLLAFILAALAVVALLNRAAMRRLTVNGG